MKATPKSCWNFFLGNLDKCEIIAPCYEWMFNDTPAQKLHLLGVRQWLLKSNNAIIFNIYNSLKCCSSQCYPVCGMEHVKEPLLRQQVSSLSGPLPMSSAK